MFKQQLNQSLFQERKNQTGANFNGTQMNNSINLNPNHILRGQRTNSLCVADKFVTQPPELSACQGHKSSTEAEISCESTAWGRAAWALRHPPTLPESAVSVATREGGGRGCDSRWKWRDKHLRARMDGWMDDGDTEKTCDERMWQGQWGAGADSSAFHSVTDWRSEADNNSN